MKKPREFNRVVRVVYDVDVGGKGHRSEWIAKSHNTISLIDKSAYDKLKADHDKSEDNLRDLYVRIKYAIEENYEFTLFNLEDETQSHEKLLFDILNEANSFLEKHGEKNENK